MPQVIFEFSTGTNNYTIASSFVDFALKRTGDFPQEPYRITAASIYFTRILVDASLRRLNIYSNSPSVNQTILTTQDMANYGYKAATYYNDVVFTCATDVNYAAVGKINLRSLQGSSSGTGSVINIRSGGVMQLRVTYEITTTACKPLTSLSLSTGVAEGNVTLQGTGAGGGTANAIIGYEVQYADSADGAAYGAFAGLTTVNTDAATFSLSVAPNGTRGHYRRFRARTLGVAGAAYYSDWRESAGVKRNVAPGQTGQVNVTPAVFESGSLSVSWAKATDADGNLSHYAVQRAIGQGAWEALLTTTALNIQDAPDVARGETVRYRVQAVDQFSVAGGYTESAAAQRNRLPGMPVVLLPGEGAETVSAKPVILLAVPPEPDGQAQTLRLSIDGGATAAIAQRQALSLLPGAHLLKLCLADSLLATGAETALSLTVAPCDWARAINTGTAITGHRADLAELFEKVNIIRAYYALESVALPGTAGDFAAWQGQMKALQAALDDCARVSGKAPTAWQAVPSTPTAAVVNQIRRAVEAA